MNITGTVSTANSKIIASAEKLQKRVQELGLQITDDYTGKAVHVVCVLENGFMFMADLVRSIGVPVTVQFVKPYTREVVENNIATTEILFSPEMDVSGKHVLLVEGVLHSGVTSEFLIHSFQSRGAASVKLAVLIDRQSQRRVSLQPDYFGFLVDDQFVYGYGLGTPDSNRNIPELAATTFDWTMRQ